MQKALNDPSKRRRISKEPNRKKRYNKSGSSAQSTAAITGFATQEGTRNGESTSTPSFIHPLEWSAFDGNLLFPLSFEPARLSSSSSALLALVAAFVSFFSFFCLPCSVPLVSRVDYVCLFLLYAWCDGAMCVVECLPVGGLRLICHSQPFRMLWSQRGANEEPICLWAIFARRVTAV
jgi:hypothetical protein